MSFLPVVLSVASGVLGAVGAVQQAQATQDAAEYNAKVSERNALVADQQRQIAVKTAVQAAEDKRRENRRTLSAMRTAYGASGLELAGSPLDVLADSSIEMALDERRIEHEGRARSYEGNLEAIGYGERAVLSRMEGDAAKRAAPITAIGYLTRAGSSLLSQQGQYS